MQGLGALRRGIADQRLQRAFDQQTATRFAPTSAASYVQSFLPTYQSGQTNVETTYGRAPDPTVQALSTALSTFANFADIQRKSNINNQPTNNQPTEQQAYYNPQNFGGLQPAVFNQGMSFNQASPFNSPNPFNQYNPYAGPNQGRFIT